MTNLTNRYEFSIQLAEAWFEEMKENTQARLGELCCVSQESISRYIGRDPLSEPKLNRPAKMRILEGIEKHCVKCEFTLHPDPEDLAKLRFTDAGSAYVEFITSLIQVEDSKSPVSFCLSKIGAWKYMAAVDTSDLKVRRMANVLLFTHEQLRRDDAEELSNDVLQAVFRVVNELGELLASATKTNTEYFPLGLNYRGACLYRLAQLIRNRPSLDWADAVQLEEEAISLMLTSCTAPTSFDGGAYSNLIRAVEQHFDVDGPRAEEWTRQMALFVASQPVENRENFLGWLDQVRPERLGACLVERSPAMFQKDRHTWLPAVASILMFLGLLVVENSCDAREPSIGIWHNSNRVIRYHSKSNWGHSVPTLEPPQGKYWSIDLPIIQQVREESGDVSGDYQCPNNDDEKRQKDDSSLEDIEAFPRSSMQVNNLAGFAEQIRDRNTVTIDQGKYLISKVESLLREYQGKY